MNITHAVKEEIKGDKLDAIFNRQKELMSKYHDIEKRSGLLQTESCPVNLDDKKGQARIKDFSWRVMEEFGEALDARNDLPHFEEELIDGLHFLTELTILSGLKTDDLVNMVGEYSDSKRSQYEDKLTFLYNESVYFSVTSNIGDLDLPKKAVYFVEQIAMMCNCLKNKPWKQTQMVTDKEEFYRRLKNVWVGYLSILSTCLSPDDIAEVYLKKSQVNKFRQRSNY